MGVLTQAMTRLRGEIVAGGRSRMALRGTLIRETEERRTQVSALCAAFAADRAGARQAWSGCRPRFGTAADGTESTAAANSHNETRGSFRTTRRKPRKIVVPPKVEGE